ncbi:uncharacterized protein [Littorina saxatilis]|uniref:Uncharacterized protein n=1 Tax=Littorina saxatilis TaxID=31220 RepID=A0AAN9AUD7_9CAEN
MSGSWEHLGTDSIDLELIQEIDVLCTKRSPSHGILVVPSNSVSHLFASSDARLIQEEVLVPKEEHDAYARMIAHSATLPNSVYKRLPTARPPPMKTWHENMTSRALKVYEKVYGENNPWVSWEFPFAPQPHPIRRAELVRPPPPLDPRQEKLKAMEAEKAKRKAKK